MSIQVANVNLAGATVGQTGVLVKFGNLLPPPTLAQQMRPQDSAESQAHLTVFNETGCLLTITLPESKQSKTVPSGRWWQFPIPPHETEVDYLVLAVAANPLFNSLLADFYGPGEPVDDMGTLGNSPIGGTVPLSVAQVINDGNPTVATVLETTPQGGTSSTAKITNDGNTLVAGLALAGARSATTAQSGIGLNSANHETEIATPQTGAAAQGITFITWDGASQKLPIAFGANGDGAATVILHDGSVFQLASIATAGKRGLAMSAARATDVNVVNTTLTTIASFTVPNESPNPVVRCSLVFLVNSTNTNNGIITAQVSYTDPFSGGAFNQLFSVYSQGASSLQALALTKATVQYSAIPMTVECKPNTLVSIQYKNGAAGAISDFVTAIIELQ